MAVTDRFLERKSLFFRFHLSFEPKFSNLITKSLPKLHKTPTWIFCRLIFDFRSGGSKIEQLNPTIILFAACLVPSTERQPRRHIPDEEKGHRARAAVLHRSRLIRGFRRLRALHIASLSRGLASHRRFRPSFLTWSFRSTWFQKENKQFDAQKFTQEK